MTFEIMNCELRILNDVFKQNFIRMQAQPLPVRTCAYNWFCFVEFDFQKTAVITAMQI